VKKNITKFGRILTITSIFIFLLLSVIPSPVRASGNVLITLSPANGTIGLSEQTINVNLDTAGTAIAVVDLYISYDPAVLSVTASKGTIAEFNNSGVYAAGDFSTGLMRIQNGMLTSYTGSGLLAVLKVKTLSAVTTAQDTTLTINSKSTATLPTDVTLTNQLTPATIGSTFTYSADPAYTRKDLPSTALFDNNLTSLLAEMLIGISLVALVIKVTNIKKKDIES